MNLIRLTKTFKYALLSIACVEVLSVAGWSWPLIGRIAFITILVGTFITGLKRLDVALWILLIELVIGSKGYLFSYNLGSYSISIRLGLFGVVLAAWLITRLTQKKIIFLKAKIFWWFLALLAALGWGIVNGLIRHHPTNNIFLDVNGFLYLGLILIFYDVIFDRKKISTTLEIMLAGIVGIALKTIILLELFAAQVSFMPSLYRWVRDTRVYEITLDKYNFYRIFSQSQIYCLFGALIIMILLSSAARNKELKKNRALITIFILATTTILISYSRSLWLSLAVTILITCIILYKIYHFRIKASLVFGLVLVAVFLAEIASIMVLVNAPHWLKARGGGVGLSSLVEERIGNTNEVALQSRWNLLKPLTLEIKKSPLLGQGFGSEVTYLSKDPRVVASTGGLYKTYSFEWGYLDLILKIGLFGLFIYLLFLYQIFKAGFRAYKNITGNDRAVIVGLLIALASLILTHATTPYLNHPLGLGLIMLCAVIFEYYNISRIENGSQPSEN